MFPMEHEFVHQGAGSVAGLVKSQMMVLQSNVAITALTVNVSAACSIGAVTLLHLLLLIVAELRS